MNDKSDMPDIDPEMSQNAVSIYGDGAMEDFPVLKAFQQYIDAEQTKSRKRLLTLCAAFGVVLALVIAAFAVMLVNIGERNQQLNDRLVEFAMRERSGMPFVFQSPTQDNATILSLTAKLDEMQKKLDEEKSRSALAVANAERAREAESRTKTLTKEQQEIKRLNALLDAEKEKTAIAKVQAAQAEKAEKERKRQEELEAYRRKHYPELYEQPAPVVIQKKTPSRKAVPKRRVIVEEVDDVDDDEPISYFDNQEDEDEEIIIRKPRAAKAQKTKTSPSKSSPSTKTSPAKKSTKSYSIPVDVRGTSTSWQIPND